ncbi:MAG: hypothetical protein V8T86_10545 [Victivallis sp.]|jgi:hypothetical protein
MTLEQKQTIAAALKNNPAGFAAGLLRRAEYCYKHGDFERAFALANASAAISDRINH